MLRGGSGGVIKKENELWRPKLVKKTKFLSVEATWMVLAIKE
jgi:hypothetical protein